MLLAVAALAIVLPSARAQSGILAAPPGPSVPPALDRFLTAVDATVPRRAGVVVFVPRGGDPRATNPVYPRALYRLYPRPAERVLSAAPVRTAHGWVAPAVPSGVIRTSCRRLRARYGLAWGLRLVAPQAAIRVQAWGGTLVQVSP